MKEFVESLKRLYHNGRITKDKVIALHNANKITSEERDYILNN